MQKVKAMVIANFKNISSKKLGFICSLVVFNHSKSFSVSVWSAKGLFGKTAFKTKEQAFNFCAFLGVSKSKINLTNQLPLFK